MWSAGLIELELVQVSATQGNCEGHVVAGRGEAWSDPLESAAAVGCNYNFFPRRIKPNQPLRDSLLVSVSTSSSSSSP